MVVGKCLELGVQGLPGKLCQMENDERQNNQARKTHPSGGNYCLQVIDHSVFSGIGSHVFMPEQNGEKDVESHAEQQNKTDYPENLSEALKKTGVAVDGVWPQINREIPKKMPDNEKDQNYAGERHNPFAADRGGKKRAATGTGFPRRRGHTAHRGDLIRGMPARVT